MAKFNDLVNKINKNDKVEEYLLNFFSKDKYKEYEIDELCDKDQKKAIRIMFDSRKDLLERCEYAFEYDPYCIEAFFTYLMLNEDIYIQLKFDEYLDQLDSYPGLNLYEKYCYITILDLYVDFLLDIQNLTMALKMQKLIDMLTNTCDVKSIARQAFIYHNLEDDKQFYRLYTNCEFSAYEYILLLVTLLKHEETLKAQEVLLDMYENIEYSTYLDHVFDLDENDPVQADLYKTVNDCYQDIMAIPTFFSWVNKTREKYGK